MNDPEKQTGRKDDASVLRELRGIYEEVTGYEGGLLTPETRLDASIGISSFSIMMIICGIEDAFDITVPNAMVKQLKTVGDMMRFIQSAQEQA